MTFRKLTLGLAITSVLMACTSCQLSQLSQIDRNGDGEITPDEVVAAAVNFVCGAQTDSSASDGSSTSDVSDTTDTASDGVQADGVAN